MAKESRLFPSPETGHDRQSKTQLVRRLLPHGPITYAAPLRHDRQRKIILIAAFVVGLEGVAADSHS